MNVEKLMIREIHTCRPETSLNEAAREMWQGDCGVLPVVDAEQRVVGMITDRDAFMGAFLQGRPLPDLAVGNSMAREVFSCRPTDTVDDVIRSMGEHRVRRLPVVDAHGELLGIVSLNDIARHVEGMQDERDRSRLAPRFLHAVATICESRREAEVPEKTWTARGRPSAAPAESRSDAGAGPARSPAARSAASSPDREA